MIVRWIDYGSLRGGLSLFSRQWGFQPPMVMMLHLWETNKKLRMVFPQAVTIAAGAPWQSGDYWLTPHAAGWAKGIEPYRAWVGQNIKRVVPLPEHVRRGLGFRTVWLSRNYPDNPQDANLTFADLPKLAKEAKQHGLDEMVVWGPQEGFLLPLPPFYKHLGGDEGFVRAVAECKKLGVNLVPFISVFNAKKKSAAKYGLKMVGSENWTFHPEFIPRFQPPYAGAYRSVQVDSHNAVWQQEVLASCRHSWTWASPRSPGTSISSSRRNRTCSRSPGRFGRTRGSGTPNRPFPPRKWAPWRSPAITSITPGTGTC